MTKYNTDNQANYIVKRKKKEKVIVSLTDNLDAIVVILSLILNYKMLLALCKHYNEHEELI